MNDPMQKENDLRQEIADYQQALDADIARFNQYQRATEDELASLESSISDILFDVAMGRGGEDRKTTARARILELKADLLDFPALFERVESSGRAKILARKSKVTQLVQRRKSYEELKERMEEDQREIGIGSVETLRGYAKSLGCEQDAETFLVELQQEGAA